MESRWGQWGPVGIVEERKEIGAKEIILFWCSRANAKEHIRRFPRRELQEPASLLTHDPIQSQVPEGLFHMDDRRIATSSHPNQWGHSGNRLSSPVSEVMRI